MCKCFFGIAARRVVDSRDTRQQILEEMLSKILYENAEKNVGGL